MSSDLVEIDAVTQALEAATSVDEIKDARDKAEAFHGYFRKRAGGIRVANRWMEIVLRAERRMGELLDETVRHQGGRPKKRSQAATVLPDGISKSDSSRWQRLASLPKRQFESYVAGHQHSPAEEMTRAALLKLANEWQRERRRQAKLSELNGRAGEEEENDEGEEESNKDGSLSLRKKWQVVIGDCEETLRRIPPESVRLAFADPPYNIGVDYGDGEEADRLAKQDFINWCGRWMDGVRQALTPDGSFWVLINDENAAEFKLTLEATEFHIRQWLVWYESFGVNHSNGFNRTHRHLFWAVKDLRRFVFNAEGVNRASDRQTKYNDRRAEKQGKTWDSVWGINPPIPRLTGTCAERLPDFPTQLPLALLRPIVACASEPRDVVLDLFSGSGTTGAACLESGRRFVGIEKNEQFAALSRLRLRGLKKGGC